MSIQDSQLVLSFGKHASAVDFSSTPAALVHLAPEKWGFRPVGRAPLSREPAHPQNKRFAGRAGPLDLSKAHELEQIICGLSGNDGGAIDPEVACSDIAPILDVIFPSASIDPAGASTTATGGGAGTKTVGVTEQARFPVGSVIAVTTAAGLEVRQVRARAGANGAGDLTVDRNVTGAVTNGSTVIRFARWKEDPSVHEHVHGFFRAEWPTYRRDFKGGMSRAQFNFTVGQAARLLTSWMFTDVAIEEIDEPAFAEPVHGAGLVCANNSLWIADTAVYATELKLDLGGTMSARGANSGPQGVQGYRVSKGAGAPKPRFMVTLQCGQRTGEIDDAGALSVQSLFALDKELGEELQNLDMAFQVGGHAGGMGYFPLPSASCLTREVVVIDGYQHIQCEFECNGPDDAELGPVEVHLG